MLLVAPVREEHRVPIDAEQLRDDGGRPRPPPPGQRRPLDDPGRHPRRLQRPRPDRRRGAQPALPPPARGVPRPDRLPGPGQHQLQRPRRADRLHARGRLPLLPGHRDGRPGAGRHRARQGRGRPRAADDGRARNTWPSSSSIEADPTDALVRHPLLAARRGCSASSPASGWRSSAAGGAGRGWCGAGSGSPLALGGPGRRRRAARPGPARGSSGRSSSAGWSWPSRSAGRSRSCCSAWSIYGLFTADRPGLPARRPRCPAAPPPARTRRPTGPRSPAAADVRRYFRQF